MVDVFFRGYGKWCDASGQAICSHDFVYFAGVFRLSEYDDRIYRHLGKIECSGWLFPSPLHPDDAFSLFPGFLRSVVAFGDAEKFEGFTPEDVYFEVDTDKPYEIALAQAASAIGIKGRKSLLTNDQRVNYILHVCRGLGIDPLHVPYGKKGGIEVECLKQKLLFKNQSAFKHGWEHGNKCGAIQVQDKENYL